MRLKYRNFRRLKDTGPLYGGTDSLLTFLFLTFLFVFLAFAVGSDEGPMYFLFIPAFVCAYALVLELRGCFSSSKSDSEK